MQRDAAMLDELKRLRARIRELELQLVGPDDLSPGGELAIEVQHSLLAEGDAYMVAYNREGRILVLNRTDGRLPVSEAIGRTVFDFTAPEYHAVLRAAIDRVFETGEVVQVEAVGTIGRHYMNRLAPLRVGDRIVAVSNFAFDISERRMAEQMLRESEARWRSLAESMPDVVVLLDREQRVISGNRFVNYEPEELIGMQGSDFVVPEHRAMVETAVNEVMSTGELREVEVQDARQQRWFLSRIGPLWGDGAIVGTVSVSRDISQRREREAEILEREAKLRLLVDNLPVVVWTIDRDLRFTSGQGRGLVALGIQNDDVLNRSLYEYFRTVRDDYEPIASHLRALGGESMSYEQSWHGRRYQAFLEPLRTTAGEVTGVVGVSIDITERWNQERQVRDARDELERAVAQRTEELKAANESLLKERTVLQRLLDMHDRDRQFVSLEIHDGIVQDMTAALMYFDSSADAAAKQGGRAADGHRLGLETLRGAIQEARRMINGLRPPVLDEFGLIDAIGNHIHELEGKTHLTIDFDHEVKFDRLAPVVETAIYRIVQESLNNVVQHSGAEHAAASIHQHEEHVHITIRDSGRGFDLAQVKPKRFGLLSIRDRARLLGGEAEIHSAPGRGTLVQVVLPVADVLLPGRVRNADVEDNNE